MSNYVFIDTEVFIRNKFSLDNQNFATLINHIENENIFLVTSEIVISEIKKHIRSEIQKSIDGIFSFPILKQLNIFKFDLENRKELKNIFSNEIFNILERRLFSYAEIVRMDHASIRDVFNDYFNGISPFLGGKPEFPDAFAANSLLNWAKEKGHKIAIVSGNTKDWEKICEREEYSNHFSFYKDLSSFLASLVEIIESKQEEITAKTRQLFSHEFIREFQNVELELDTSLQTFDEDVYPELDPQSIKIEIRKINIISYCQAEDTAELEIQGEVTFTAYVDCPDPASGCYDSEEKEMIFYWERYTGNVEATRDFACSITISKENDDYKIENCKINEPRSIELTWNNYNNDYSPTDTFIPSHSTGHGLQYSECRKSGAIEKTNLI